MLPIYTYKTEDSSPQVTERIFVLEFTHWYIIQSNLNYNGPSPNQTQLSWQKSAYRVASQVQGNFQLTSNFAVKGGGWVMVVGGGRHRAKTEDLSLKTRQETELWPGANDAAVAAILAASEHSDIDGWSRQTLRI